MSGEDFLRRWSRRKQKAKVAEDTPPMPAPEAGALPNDAGTAAEPKIDLAKLPALDSITAATDITEFLRKGIPAELSRAALRRAWATDPAIRDFVGLAENAWDFTDPSAMAGFGELQGTPEHIRAMVERVMGAARENSGELASKLLPSEDKPQLDQDRNVSSSVEAATADTDAPASDLSEAKSVIAAQPEDSAEGGDVVPARRRAHGGALPT